MQRYYYMVAISLVVMVGCDWDHYAMMNGVPVEGDADRNKTVHVYLAVDGLAYDIVQEAQQKNIVPKSLATTKFITMFPATSDASWTRILKTKPLDGLEFNYYDKEKDEINKSGIAGLLAHGVPPLKGIWSGPDYLQTFDYHADGYFDTLWTYASLDFSYQETLDNLFMLLAARSELQDVFWGYILDLDSLAHMKPRQEVYDGFIRLWSRIEAFKSRHPKRKFVFTLVSDHGNDFIPAGNADFIDFRDEMRQFGVEPVEKISDGKLSNRPFAVPILHTPISYLALHTTDDLAPTVAKRCSQSQYVDVVISKIEADSRIDGEKQLQWVGVWRAGELLLSFGYDDRGKRYYFSSLSQTQKLGFTVVGADKHTDARGTYDVADDDVLFAASAHSDYPDLFHRVRTCLLPMGIKNPANVYISYKRPYTSSGYQVGSLMQDNARAGVHGSLDAKSATGVILTEERDLPESMRADDFLDYFPRLKKHIHE